MNKLYTRRTELNAEDCLNLEWSDAYRVEREIKEDLEEIYGVKE